MKVLLALIVLVVSATAFAQNRIVSIDAYDLSYTAGLAFKSDTGDVDRDTTDFRLNLNYAQSLADYVGLMWKAQLNFNREDIDQGSQDTFVSSYGVAGGLLYNFQPGDVKNSFMVGGIVGIARETYEFGSLDDDSGYSVSAQFEGGKRWDLGNYSVANISYAPTASITFKRYGGDIRENYFTSGNEIRFNFLKFDILF